MKLCVSSQIKNTYYRNIVSKWPHVLVYQLYLYLYKDPSWIKCAHLNHTLLGIFYIECVFIGVCICATHIISETWHDMTKTSKPVPNSCSYEKERKRDMERMEIASPTCVQKDHFKIDSLSRSISSWFSWTLSTIEENAYHENRSFLVLFHFSFSIPSPVIKSR